MQFPWTIVVSSVLVFILWRTSIQTPTPSNQLPGTFRKKQRKRKKDPISVPVPETEKEKPKSKSKDKPKGLTPSPTLSNTRFSSSDSESEVEVKRVISIPPFQNTIVPEDGWELVSKRILMVSIAPKTRPSSSYTFTLSNSSSSRPSSLTLTKKQRENIKKTERIKAEKAALESLQKERLNQHRRNQEHAKIGESSSTAQTPQWQSGHGPSLWD